MLVVIKTLLLLPMVFDTEAEYILAAITSYNNGAVYDKLDAGNTPAQDVTDVTTGPTLDTKANDVFPLATSSTSANAHYGYGYAPTIDPFASDFNPLLDDVFASMNSEASTGGLEHINSPNTSATIATAPDNVTSTSASPQPPAADAAAVTEPRVSPQVSANTENAPQAARFGEDDFFGGLDDFPDFPKFDEVAISPTTSSHKSPDATSAAAATAEEHLAGGEAASTSTTNIETSVNGTSSFPTSSAVDDTIFQDHKPERSTSPPGTPPASASNPPIAETLGSTSTTATVTDSSPKIFAASSNTSPATTQPASFSKKYVSPFVSDEEDLFPPMDSFEDFLSSDSSPESHTTALPSGKSAAQNVVDLTADTPVTAHFPAMSQAHYNVPLHARPGHNTAMPARPAYSSRTPVQPAYTSAMPTQQYRSAFPYINAAPAMPYQPQKQIWEMSDTEITSWVASAGVPPVPTPAPASTMPGLESPHYASTELPQPPYTSPMPRKAQGVEGVACSDA